MVVLFVVVYSGGLISPMLNLIERVFVLAGYDVDSYDNIRYALEHILYGRP